MRFIFFHVLVFSLFLMGCQSDVVISGGSKYFCESSSDCWDIDSFECSLENIDLSHDYEEINSSVAVSANYNHFGQVCYNGLCYCQGNWYTNYD